MTCPDRCVTMHDNMNLLVALVAWIFMTFGITYIVSRAEITEPIRVWIVSWVPALALLLSCRACTAFWASQVAAATVMGLCCGLGYDPPWHAWLYLPPASGFAAIGLIDLIAFGKHGAPDA